MGASASKSRAHGTKRRLSYSGNHPDRPSPPGKPQLVPGTSHFEPDVVTIRWDPPVYDGGSRITGYLVEHRRTGSPHWVRSAPALLKVPELTLSGLEPGWRYQFRVSAQNSAGMSEPGDLSELLTVTLQRTAASAPHFIMELRDVLATENEKAELTVEVRGTPNPTIAWYKDGMEVFSGRRHRIVTENGCSTLIIYQAALSDEGEFKCTATNRVGHAVTKANLRMQAPPSIRLPRQYEDGLLFEKDEVIRLKVSVAGKPLPTVTWQHNGEPITNNNRCEISSNERHATLRIDEARRSDRGEYQVRAINQLGEDIASFLVTVTDRPQGPGKACVVMTLGRSVTLSWAAPEDDGGCKIGNYIVEYYRIGWNMWLKAATCRQLTTTLGDLIQGSEYKFRVKAENPFGVSEPGEESDVLFIPDPQRGLLSPPEHRETADSPAGSKGPGHGMMDWLSDSSSLYESLSVSSASPVPERTKRKLRTPTISDDEEMRMEKEVFDKARERGPKAPKRRAKLKDKNKEIEELKERTIEIENVDNKKKSERVTDENDLTHGSSELMLVLLPNRSRETTEERESTKREIIESLRGTHEGVAPPMSLSAPELGSIEPESVMQRAWVSSTELLHERAMARFYQAVADEESEKSTRRQRKYSTDRRHSTSSSASTYSQGEMTLAAMFARSFSQEEIFREKKSSSQPDQRSQDEQGERRQGKDDISLQTTKKTAGGIGHWQPSEDRRTIKEEEYGDEEELDEEEEEDYSIETEGEEEEEEEEEDDVYEYELEDEEEMEKEEEERKLVRDTSVLGESEGENEERPSKYIIEEDTYHPRSMIPRAFSTAQTKSSTSISDNLKVVGDVVSAVVSHSITLPVGIKPVTTSLKPVSSLKPPSPEPLVRIEVTPPPEHSKSVAKKPTSKQDKQKSPEVITSSRKENQQFFPPRFTPDGRYLPNPNPQLPKPILKLRDNSEERIIENQNSSGKDKKGTPPLASVEPELNIISSSSRLEITPDRDNKKKKNVRIEEPEDKRSDLNWEDNDTSLRAAGEAAKNKRGRTSSPSSLASEIEADPTKCLIHHYSDIVKEFGHVKKASTPLYLNYEDLKAAAQKAEAAQSGTEVVDEIREEKTEKTSNRKEEEPDESMKMKIDLEEKRKTKLIEEHKIVEETKEQEEKEEREQEKEDEKEGEEEKEKKEEEEEKTVKDVVVEKVIAHKYKRKKDIEFKSHRDYDFDQRVAKLEQRMLEFTKRDEYKEETKSHHPISVRKPQEYEIQRYYEEPYKSSVVKHNRDILFQVAEKKVHSYVDYFTDVAMFIVACWLYAFKDERLAIPILALMVYRQAKDYTKQTLSNMKQSIKNKIPARWRRKTQ